MLYRVTQDFRTFLTEPTVGARLVMSGLNTGSLCIQVTLGSFVFKNVFKRLKIFILDIYRIIKDNKFKNDLFLQVVQSWCACNGGFSVLHN